MHPFQKLHGESRRQTRILDSAYVVETHKDYTRVTGPGAEPHDNTLVYSALRDSSHARNVIAEQIAHFGGLRKSFEWKYCDYDTPTQLATLLEDAGFLAEEAETVMAFPVAQALKKRSSCPAAIRPIRDDDWTALGDMTRIVFGSKWDWLSESLKRELANEPNRLEVYVAELDGKIVSAGWVRFEGRPEAKFASLWGGSTLPEYRERGLYTALVEARRASAERKRLAYLAIEAGPLSAPIVGKLGFERVCRTIPFVWRV